VRVCCYVITVHSCLETAVNVFLIEAEALLDKVYSILKFCPSFIKWGTIHKTGFTGEAKKNVEDTFLFIANKLFEQTNLIAEIGKFI